MFNDVEIEVCEALLNLAALIHHPSEACPKIPFTWGLTKRRSTKTPPSIPDFSTPAQDYIADDVNHNIKLDKVEASSPDTPLSFSPSQYDDKSKHSSLNKSLKKRTREELMELIEGLTQSTEVLRGEVENVRNYRNKLKAENTVWKAVKHEVFTNYVRQQQQQFPNMEMKDALSTSSENLGINTGQPQHQGIVPLWMHHHHHHHHPHPHNNNYVVVPHCHVTLTTITAPHPLFSTSNSNVNSVEDGPRGIPDLNVSADEEVLGVESSQPLDHHQGQSVERRKAAAAERRRMRRMIKKKKSEQHRSR